MAAAGDPNDGNNEFFKNRNLDRDMSFDDSELQDEERQVAEDTQKIFRSFIFTRLISEIERDTEDGDLNVAEIPNSVINNIQEEKKDIEKMGEDPNDQMYIELGQVLANLGDEVHNKYGNEFKFIVSELNLQEEFAYESFTKIARRLFSDGCNWGRIVSLFLFAYEIAVSFIRRGSTGIRSFLRRILRYFVGFLFKEKIVNWIIEQGGWVSF